jgi:hypothetical protein
MNFQQTYDLIGQILRERPELATKEVVLGGFVNGLDKITYHAPSEVIYFAGSGSYISDSEEIVWQNQ